MVAKSPAKRIQGGKKVRVQQDLKAIKSEARADQARAILLEIMERLQDDDELAADVLAALKEGFFDDSGADRLMLHESYTYLTKVPKYVEIQNLEQMDSRFTREVLRRLSKPDNRVVKRLHSLATLTDPTMRIPSHDLHIFKAWALWRHRDGKEKLKAVQWDASYNIDWQSCGVFSLKPAFEQRGADEDDEAFARRRKEHQYTHLAFETLQVEVDGITAGWTIENNFSIKCAQLLAPVHCKPRARFVCKSLFADVADFQKRFKFLSANDIDEMPDSEKQNIAESPKKQRALQRNLSAESRAASEGAAAETASNGKSSASSSRRPSSPAAPPQSARNALDAAELKKRLGRLRKSAGTS